MAKRKCVMSNTLYRKLSKIYILVQDLVYDKMICVAITLYNKKVSNKYCSPIFLTIDICSHFTLMSDDFLKSFT